MPVRIYDIAKKLGIESKEVIAKAKELGIAGAKVPSSSLDKITAEYLEVQLGGAKPLAAEPGPENPGEGQARKPPPQTGVDEQAAPAREQAGRRLHPTEGRRQSASATRCAAGA